MHCKLHHPIYYNIVMFVYNEVCLQAVLLALCMKIKSSIWSNSCLNTVHSISHNLFRIPQQCNFFIACKRKGPSICIVTSKLKMCFFIISAQILLSDTRPLSLAKWGIYSQRDSVVFTKRGVVCFSKSGVFTEDTLPCKSSVMDTR